ncbi:ribosomal-processing cysteine protease Prp [Thermosipho ferrireducens]|uniref:Ribosomal processing cysteine protease Prp n=1 Tax=Thermosipho ferrireducens TaxID=2571116 RepID=A0ABX7S5P4_9BACT|nr:ribosomal-processing cysteine protease Prp [Thermosipho ferrireducens]QTA37148.1 ribosomal-processing cysteine protease Prp [Thermosipho ferrireducens]
MIKCVFVKRGFFEKFEITGHSLYAKKGEDIVCAAVSTVVQHTARFLKKNGAKVKVDEGYLLVKDIVNNEISQIFVEELFQTLQDLQSQYPKYVKVEVKHNEN